MKSKFGFLFLALALFAVQQVAAKTYSGTDGNIHWSFDTESGKLLISGTGAMNDYSWSDSVIGSPDITSAPWGTYYSSIKTVIIQLGVTSVGSNAFSGCSSLTSITIPKSVTNIGIHAFKGCSFTSITIPHSITSIGEGTFANCSALTSITIPRGVTDIGEDAFSGCSALTSITIPNSVTSIGDYAFCDCSSLTSITIPDSVTSIGGCAFYGCSALTSITIPNSVTDIGEDAFSGCSALTSITISNSVTSISKEDFQACSGLTSLTIPFVGKSANANGKESILGYLFGNVGSSSDKWKSVTQYYSDSESSPVTIPLSLDSVIITNCTNVEYGALYGCTMIKYLELPETLTGVGEKAFYGCTGLRKIVCRADMPPGAFENTFTGISKGACMLIVPTGSGEMYRNSDGWKEFYTIKEGIIGSGVKTPTYENTFSSHEIYDLQGRRVAHPTKGIYIINGRKKVYK